MKNFNVGAVAALLVVASPAFAAPTGLDCQFEPRALDVDSYQRIPSTIRGMIGGMADKGQPFQSTDVIGPGPRLPGARFLRGGHRAGDWFVWFEHGGVAYSWQVAAFHVDANGKVTIAGSAMVPVSWNHTTNGWMPHTDVCRLVEGLWAGRYPPYPADVSGTVLY